MQEEIYPDAMESQEAVHAGDVEAEALREMLMTMRRTLGEERFADLLAETGVRPSADTEEE